LYDRKSLKIPKGQSESVYRRRTDNAMDKRKSTKGQTTINKTYILESPNGIYLCKYYYENEDMKEMHK
jgi:hypothetical protein